MILSPFLKTNELPKGLYVTTKLDGRTRVDAVLTGDCEFIEFNSIAEAEDHFLILVDTDIVDKPLNPDDFALTLNKAANKVATHSLRAKANIILINPKTLKEFVDYNNSGKDLGRWTEVYIDQNRNLNMMRSKCEFMSEAFKFYVSECIPENEVVLAFFNTHVDIDVPGIVFDNVLIYAPSNKTTLGSDTRVRRIVW